MKTRSADRKRPFFIVDVFAEAKYSGNQLAVIADAEGLPPSTMQKIARETNFSETTFIMSGRGRDGGYGVRIFTPGEEVPFAGHPVLGTAFIIRQEMAGKAQGVTLDLKAGRIPVSFTAGGVASMRQLSPEFGHVFRPGEIAKILGMAPGAIDERFPIEEVSTGLPCIIVPLKRLEDVRRARIDTAKYMKLAQASAAKAILVFCPETYRKENDLNVRFFAGYYGIPEDPATGSANGCLAGYLARHRYFGKPDVQARVEQGYEIGRRSLILISAQDRQGAIDVNVAGRVLPVARGELA
ncbi:MAG: PhzF family phenazine biosynthesis protein [Nitrospiraceae bacterium]|nr:PhzF family phenazine biosynthesis protein [Nitrospiraceae bacterium]